ncbi:MAG: TRAP transporter small permease [Rhodospirillaceae bacterium]
MSAVFERLHGGFKNISQVAVWLGGFALLLSAIMVTLDVIFRKLFGLTLSGSDEITGYVFAAATTWAYSFCLLNRSNIRIDALYNTLSIKPRAVLDVIGMVLLAYYVYLLTVSGFEMFVENLEYNSSAQTTLATPLWIPQTFWLSGLAFFLVCLVFLVIYGLFALLRKDWSTVSRIAGIKTVEEEISEETFVK